MHQVWETLIENAVDVGIVASVILIIVVALGGTERMQNAIAANHDATAVMREYREYNQYDNKYVYPQDVISAVYAYHGRPAIQVRTGGTTYAWSEFSTPIYNGHAVEYNTASIAQCVDESSMYFASIVKDANGSITMITFIQN